MTELDDMAKLTRVIRVNVIGGTVILALAALTLVLVAVGFLPLSTQVVVSLIFALMIASLMILTARGVRQDRDDPGGVERRFQSQAVSWSAALLGVGLVSVVGVTAWGLLR